MPAELVKILAEIETHSDYYGDFCPLVLKVNNKSNYESAKTFLKNSEQDFGMIAPYPLFFPDIHLYGTKIQAKRFVSALFDSDARYKMLRKYFKKDVFVFTEPEICS